jgi:hypothetical protein
MKAHFLFTHAGLTVELEQGYSERVAEPLPDSLESVRAKLTDALEVVIRKAQTSLSTPDAIYLCSSPVDFARFPGYVRAAVLMPATEHVSIYKLIASAIESLNTMDVGMRERAGSILIEQMLSYESTPRIV